MRCSEARRRLIKSGGKVPEADGDLSNHLLSCPDCTNFAAAELMLRRDLASTAADDGADDLPLSILRTRVEARATSGHTVKTKEIPLMSAVYKQIRKRPGLGVTFGIVAAVLAFVTLIPFSFENTVGYEVAIAGVNKDLAMDSEKVHTLLLALGLDNAHVDVSGCDTTCVVKISELNNEGDVNIVITAFDKLGNCVLDTIDEVHMAESMSLLKHFQQNLQHHIFITEDKHLSMDYAYHIVDDALLRLDSVTVGGFSIWVTDDNDTLIMNGPVADTPTLITIDEISMSDDHITLYGDSVHDSSVSVWIAHNPDKQLFQRAITDKYATSRRPQDWWEDVAIIKGESGKKAITLIDDEGEVHTVDLDDPDFEEKLEALGIRVQMSERDGELYFNFNSDADSGHTELNIKSPEGFEYLDPSKPDAGVQMPENFELKQNHPNPFNPDTRIDFTIPEAQHVKLEVFNVSGQKICTLIDADMDAGEHSIIWDATDDTGERIASGVYLYRLTSGIYTTSKKMTLLK